MIDVTKKTASALLAAALGAGGLLAMSGCSTQQTSTDGTSADETADGSSSIPTKDSIRIDETISNDEDGGHAIEDDGEEQSYANVKVEKTGDSESDEADFYGNNSAVFATNGATLSLNETVIETDGRHANAVFSYGEGTVLNISDSVIETQGDCSGGLMTTGGGTMNATNLRITTQGNSSAAIRSDRGGGDVNVSGGVYETHGTGSPAIYSTADVEVSDAELTSDGSQGVVIEGSNSVKLSNTNLVADNTEQNSDKTDLLQAVMIYQSMSGDAAEGTSSFSMTGGSITNKTGDVFFVNNTVATIELDGVGIVNEDSDGEFLRAEAAGWGSEGSNGGQVDLTATSQEIDGDVLVDESSNLNLCLKDGSTFDGAVNPDGAVGEVYVELSGGAKWVLTADSHITSLTCDAGSIDLNGHKLYVGDQEYDGLSASTGTAIEHTYSSGGQMGGAPGEGGQGGPGQGGEQVGDGSEPPEKPDGEQATDGEEPPEKPDGEQTADGEEPPEKPSGDNNSSEPPEKPDGSSSSSNSNTKKV